MMSQPGKKTIGIYILSNMSPSKDNHAMKLWNYETNRI